MDKIILASSSPRRKMLLEQIGIPFNIIISNVEEIINSNISPSELVKSLSKQKAENVSNNLKGDFIVIGADTVVVYKGKILGKPKDKKEAFCMLSMLQGNIHEVYTGITIIRTKDKLIKTGVEKTEVYMRELSSDLINSYIETNEPMDKAGAYGIQGKGAVLIDKIHGDYNNVVGLPLNLLSKLLEEIGINIFKDYIFKL
ncbi:nucleoside triphosphate pyrophosphatase [Defluviitalea phaphyphila]|uniref:nucleoside triphosphate pyrophosphatase n=1 Tax=Defluviitalea phaphyphila TaxID=1473580 RepID=UPI000730BC45|nr:Maf family protein [Defluviitalea phaphyphila]